MSCRAAPGERGPLLVAASTGRCTTPDIPHPPNRVEVDPGRASVAPSAEGSDETIVVRPRRLARQLTPLEVEVDADGLVRALALELRAFRPVVFTPGLRRPGRGERVAVHIALGDFGRALSVQTPRCIAME